jgi:integrase/recombinase XerC
MAKRKTKLIDALNTFYDRYENAVTVNAYRQDLDPMAKFLLRLPHVGGYIDHVTTLDVQNFIATIRKGKLDGSKYSPSTINKKIKGVKAFFNWAKRSKLVEGSPADEIKNARVPDDSRKMGMITAEELERVLTYCSFPFREREQALFMFLGDTGVRRGGCASLRLQDLDFDTSTAWVTEKFEKTHQVFLGEACMLALKRWLERRNVYEPEAFVFSRDGGPITPASLGQLFRRVCIAAGIGSRGPHEMRRFKITQLLDAGVNPETVRKAVNHSNVGQTLKYVRKTSDDVRDAMRRFSVGGTRTAVERMQKADIFCIELVTEQQDDDSDESDFGTWRVG